MWDDGGMNHRRRPTIRDVAQAAGVSTQTVSRVLNNRPDVAPETLARVQQIIAETGYAPNMLARSLTQGRSRILGVVAYGLEYFGPSQLVTGIERQAAAMGYSITLTLIPDPETADADVVLSALFARQVDGVLWAVADVGANRAWLESRKRAFPVPLILVGGSRPHAPVPSIGVDNRAIGCLATEHLMAGGARGIGIITGPMNWWEAREREAGWRETVQTHGIPLERCFMESGDWTPGSGEEAFYRLVERCPEIDAVFASNDQMALGVLHAAHKLRLRIPDDISVVGVDNMAEASHFWPSLTTVHQPLDEAGALAVRELDTIVERSHDARAPFELPAPEPRLLQPTLLVRESSRPVRVDMTAAVRVAS